MSLERQLAMNRQTWQTLQEHGVTEQSRLRLDFFYFAPNEQQANALASFLRNETDYDVATSSGGGFMRKRPWIVNGSTQETTISLAILDDWVRWMVSAGQANGGCEFDGWGAAVA